MKFVIDHANINVADVDRSIKFYKEALGLQELRRNVSADYKIVFLTDEIGKFKLELTWLANKKGAYNLGDNESHIAFVTDDFDAALAHHKQMGCVSYENKAMGIYFIEDPDGYWMEILPKRNR